MFHSELQQAPYSSYSEIPEDKALVLLGSKHTFSIDSWLVSADKKFHLQGDYRFTKNKDVSKSPNSQFRAFPQHTSDDDPYFYDVFVVDPGSYHLSRIRLNFGEYSLSTGSKSDGLSVKTKQPVYASFKAEKGDIIYIGNLDVAIHQPFAEFVQERGISRLRFFEVNIVDKYDSAVQILRKQYPTLSGDIKKSLAQKGNHAHFDTFEPVKNILRKKGYDVETLKSLPAM